jgi:hypothetical protein
VSSGRARDATIAGGQPVDFPLGIMRFPRLDGAECPTCKTLNVAGSYVVNADNPHPELAAELLDVRPVDRTGRCVALPVRRFRAERNDQVVCAEVRIASRRY